jgi:hypothetical protein
MNNNLTIFISILIVIIIIINWNSICNKNEKFDILSNQYIETSHSYKSKSDKSKPSYHTGLSYQPANSLACCLVEKKYLPDNTNQFGGSFKYKYKKLENENCDLKLFRLDSNKQLLFEGENEWSNEYCSNKTNKLGSCRYINKECIDFVSPEFCKKLNMTWSEKSCHDPLEFKWVDRINLKIPKLKSDGKFVLFDKESDLSKIKNKRN